MHSDNFTFGTETDERKMQGIEKLSAEEERDLSIKILAGEEAKKQLGDRSDLSEAERQKLLNTIASGENAFDTLVLANWPRAHKTAAETYRKNQFGLNECEDYEQTALTVICRCARTYDWKLGCRFSTYVHRSLTNEMMRENAKYRYAVRIPEENLPAVRRLKTKAADGDEISKAAGSSDMMDAVCSIPLSLQSPLSQDETDIELGDTIPDPAALTAEEVGDRIDLDAQIKRAREAFSRLSEDERNLLKGRLGFDGEQLPLRAFVGTTAKSVSGVQKKQIAAVKHLREIYFSLPMAF